MKTSKKVVAQGKVCSVRISVGCCVLAFLKGRIARVLHPKANDIIFREEMGLWGCACKFGMNG